MKKLNLKKASVFSLSLLLGGVATISPALALEILANNYSMTATAEPMSAQQLCESAGLVSTDPTDNVTWKCSSGNLNTTVANRYSINVTATDHNTGETKTKTIQIRVTAAKTNSAPVLKLSQTAITIKKGQSVNLASYIASASDAEDGDLRGAVKISGGVDTGKAGTYTVTYTVADKEGLTATATLTVTVVEDDSAKDDGGSDSSKGDSNQGGSSNNGNNNGGNTNNGTGGTSRPSNTPTLPDTADNSAYLLGGLATLAIGGLAVVKKRKEIAE